VTTVNWERLSGDAVEELAAALILRGRAEGNRVTPSRGDRGIDLRVWNGSSWEIYQIKRYCRPLTRAQAREVEASWNTFVVATLPVLQASAWHLVMPWDPTNERLEWLAALTGDSGIQTDWIGRSQLDFVAADNPQVVAYFQGDGAAHLQRLLTSALRGGNPPPDGTAGEALLEAVAERQTALATSLDEVDPFYRYEINVRAGPLPEDWAASSPETDDAALIVYRQTSEKQHTVMRILPRDALAPLVRPITQTISFDVSEPAHRQMVENFARYGAPIAQVPATTLKSDGPPGANRPVGSTGLVSIVVPEHDGIPDLELRICGGDGRQVCSLPLGPAEVSTGSAGPGMRIAAWDTSHSLRAEFLLSKESGVPSQLTIETSELSGKPATRVVAVARFVAAVNVGCTIELAIVGGLPVSGGWEAGDFPSKDRDIWADILQDLVEIQAHTHVVIRVPETLTAETAEEIKRIARLLRGEVLRYEPNRVALTLAPDAEVVTGPLAVRFHRAIVLDLDGQEIPVDRYELVHSPSARIDVKPLDDCGDREAFVVFDTPATVHAIESPPE
jgi:hypothetical protein